MSKASWSNWHVPEKTYFSIYGEQFQGCEIMQDQHPFEQPKTWLLHASHLCLNRVVGLEEFLASKEQVGNHPPIHTRMKHTSKWLVGCSQGIERARWAANPTSLDTDTLTIVAGTNNHLWGLFQARLSHPTLNQLSAASPYAYIYWHKLSVTHWRSTIDTSIGLCQHRLQSNSSWSEISDHQHQGSASPWQGTTQTFNMFQPNLLQQTLQHCFWQCWRQFPLLKIWCWTN